MQPQTLTMTRTGDDEPGCPVCTRSAFRLQAVPHVWECSHMACPFRRPVTAAPAERALRCDPDGCWRQRPQVEE